jgi:predicted acyl esterase
VKNVPESNGRVGMIGSSYDGFTPLMALINPHPALKAAVPQSPMVDGWMGDDWFHYGAFRQHQLRLHSPARWQARRTAKWTSRATAFDDYDNFLRAGSAGDFGRKRGPRADPASGARSLEHPAYDAFWQEQALDKILAKQPLKVPTLWSGLWDQEDMYGAIHAYKALSRRTRPTT